MDQRADVARANRGVLLCDSLPAAQQRIKETLAPYALSAPNRAAKLEENLPKGFTVFALPAAHQARLRTFNALDRINQELKRRTGFRQQTLPAPPDHRAPL
jgi:transposase-like protein